MIKIKLEKFPNKMLGQSWLAWFLETLALNGFEKVNANKFVKGSTEVRVFRSEKYYQVYEAGSIVEDKINLTFPHLTGYLV